MRAMQDRRFNCQYHRDYGHETDSCQELKKAIEQLIQNDKLKIFSDTVRRNWDSKDGNRDKSKQKKYRIKWLASLI